MRKILLLVTFIGYLLPIFSQQEFTISQIPDSIWQKMQGKSYHPNNQIRREDLRYLRISHWDDDGQTHNGELICNRRIADKLIRIFRELYRQHYPIERMRLPDEYNADDEQQMSDNNTSCFCYRQVDGTKKLSYHARGLAIDINTRYNPYVRKGKDGRQKVSPSNGKPYADRSKTFRYKITRGDLCYRLFISEGFTWGGDWRTMKDYQHFEYKK